MFSRSLDLDTFAQQGILISRDFFNETECAELLAEAQSLERQFKAASISQQRILATEIRNDKTLWLDQDQPAASKYLQVMQTLQETLNREFYLGLKSYEAHYALYPAGHFYKTHIDNPRNQGNRRVTTVLFLNPDWAADLGGELNIYAPISGDLLHQVVPRVSTLVVFRSELFPHEVLPPQKDRWSIAGWFRLD